jgi:HD superfamily phosphohydrolase YqeK
MSYFRDGLIQFENIFSKYSDQFLTGNTKFDKNILLKIEHSLLVQQECRYLAEAEGFSPRIAALTEISGLFHDIGRFEQLKKFNTFVDSKSIDHGELGIKVLKETAMLDFLSSKDLEIVLKATQYHNKRALPENLEDELLIVLKAVRDADKLDIMRVLLSEYAKGKLDKTVILHLEETDKISPNVLAHLQKRETPFIKDFKTLTDFKMAQLSWVYDLNFNHSLYQFKKRGFFEEAKSHLPKTKQLEELCSQMLKYLDNGKPTLATDC